MTLKITSYLLKCGTRQNDPKLAKMRQNQPKRPPKIVKQPEMTQSFKIGEICNFVLAFVFQILSPNAQILAFWAKSINFLILMKFRMYPISKVPISNLILAFENFEPIFPNLGILGQKVPTFQC